MGQDSHSRVIRGAPSRPFLALIWRLVIIGCVDIAMAFSAEACQIVERIIQLVSIDMMDMQVYTPSFALLATFLAGPLVAVFDLLAKGFPVMRVIPLCYTALPRRIILASNSATQRERFGLSSDWNRELSHKLDNGSSVYFAFIGNAVKRALVVYVLIVQPIGALVQCALSVMTNNIDIPSVLATVPVNRAIATAITKRRIFTRRKVDNWLTSLPAGVRFLHVSGCYIVAFKNIIDCLWRYLEHPRNRISPGPCSVLVGSYVQADYFCFDFSCNLFSHNHISFGGKI